MNYTRLINKSEDFIEENLSEKITLEMIANHLNISKYYFHHIFSENSKESLKTFITRIKMERSVMFLAVNKSVSITEIAFRYGYSSSSSFNKAFKKHFGVNPTQYRKARKDKQ